MPLQDLGASLVGPLPVPGGTAQIFENGIALDSTAGGGATSVQFAFPMIGQPVIATGQPANAQILEPAAITFQLAGWQMASLGAALDAIFADRIALLPTAQAPAPVHMTLAPAIVVAPARSGVQAIYGTVASAPLQERLMYDIAIRADDGVWHRVAPHAVYYRQAWHDFGLVHITDIHAARRIDWFPKRLADNGQQAAADSMANWNDRFRGFVRYANYLHDQGLLDVILATGDIVDYLYENDDDRSGGGNPLFVRTILLGQSPSDRLPDVEELRVPFFVTRGNHDYREHPYALVANLDMGVDVHKISQYAGYKLTEEQAVIADRGHPGDVPSLSAETCATFIEFDPDAPAFRSQLVAGGNYVIRLGSHRIVMLDSGHDTELPVNKTELVLSKFGALPEGKLTAIDGSPNSIGVTAEMLNLVVDTLDETPDDGLFIVGLHAPLFNMWDEEYPYFLRETQRAAQPLQSLGWVSRRTDASLNPEQSAHQAHPSWFGTGSEPVEFVKRGDVSDLFDYGVSRGASYEMLKAVAGIGQRRKADLVLHGHIHRWFEVRLAVESGDLAYYCDFYTQNLAHYYPAKYVTGWRNASIVGSVAVDDAMTFVDVANDAPASNQPTEMPVPGKFGHVVSVPPYSDPLSNTNDPKGWWARHRPLVVQTEAYGPFKESHANLAGFRLITVKNDVIARIDLASTETLQAYNYRVDWSKVTTPDPQRPYQHVQRSKEFDQPAAESDPCMSRVPANNSQTLVYRDHAGRILELWRDAQGGRGVGNLTGSAPTAVGNPSTYVDPVEKMIIVPYRGADSHVHSLYWNTGAVGHDALSASVNAPPASGDPVGYLNTVSGTHHVMYRSGDKHLRCLSWQGQGAVNHEDLTGGANAPLTKGDPAAWFDSKRGVNIVAYRAADDHIRTIYWSNGPSGLDDLSGFARSPQAASDPVGYYVESQDLHQVYYRGVDNHIYELWWIGETPVAPGDLTAQTGAPPAQGAPRAWFNLSGNRKHVVYRGLDDHIHCIRWVPATAPEHIDLCVEALAPPAAGAPYGFSDGAQEHVVYRGIDNQVHEIRWAEPNRLLGEIVTTTPVFIGFQPR